MRKNILAVVFLLISSAAAACPDGQYEQCVVPRPWGGCAQKVCIPNSGTVVGGTSDVLADLNQGIIHVGDQIVSTSSDAGRGLANIANRVDDVKLSQVDWSSVILAGTAIYYGALCVASEGVAPGGPVPGSVVDCSVNSCACSAVALAILVKNRSDMSPEQRDQTQAIVENPTFQSAVQTPQTLKDADKQLSAMGILRKPVTAPRPRPTPPTRPRPCPGCILP